MLPTKSTTLTPLNKTKFYFNCALHACYMCRYFLTPSSGMSIQKSAKGRYNEIMKMYLLLHDFCIDMPDDGLRKGCNM